MGEPTDELEGEPTDGREKNSWKTRYEDAAWRQIWIELSFLLVLMFFCSAALVYIGAALTFDRNATEVHLPLTSIVLDRSFLRWLAVAFAGMLGGTSFDLKWLYHSVAKGLWNQDRVLWRIIVPFISGIVSVFLAFMIVSGIVPFLKADSFKSLYFGLGFGFLFGYFSDSVLAALKKFADGVFGRTNDPAPHS
jgi:hypothetical protein